VLAKLLANRLRIVVGNAISDGILVVKGRQNLDGILVASWSMRL